MLIYQVLAFLIIVSGIWLAIWVYSDNRKSKINKIFSLFTVSFILWAPLPYFFNLTNLLPISLYLVRFGYGVVSLFLAVFYFFSTYFPRIGKRYPTWEKILLIIGIGLFFISTFTSLIVENVELTKWGVNPIFGAGKIIYFGWVFFITLISISLLFWKYFSLPENEKIQVQYVFIGLIIFVVPNLIFNVLFPFLGRTTQVRYYPLGNYSAIFLLGFTAYAIVKRELFGIKVVLTYLFVGLIAILLLLDIFVFTSQRWLQGLKGVIFVIFLYFGYLLIKSVLLEIQRRQEIEKVDRAKSEFISIASHQLRTPLTAIKGYISMILEGTYGKLPEKQARPLENVYQSNERLIKLVNDLLNLSRLDAGKIEFSPELISLEEMVSDIIEELRINAEKKGLYMRMVKPSEPLPKIMVDQDKLRQVILNIVDNAIKYTKEGGVTFELKKLDEQEEIKVSDTGEGMDEKELNSLFQMFSRATAGTQLHTEGAGLGLYVARQFIEMHGGKIWAESPGKSKGSTFYIRLPIHLDPKLLKTKTKTITKAPNDIF